VTGSTDGQVFVVSGLSSKKFEPLGYTSKHWLRYVQL